MGVGDYLRKARKDAGMSMAAVGQDLGMSAAYVCQIELGQRLPYKHVASIIEYFGLDLDYAHYLMGYCPPKLLELELTQEQFRRLMSHVDSLIKES